VKESTFTDQQAQYEKERAIRWREYPKTE